MKQIIFKINEKESIQLISNSLPMKEVYSCFELKIFLQTQNEYFLIGAQSSSDFMNKLERLLSLALQNKLSLNGPRLKSRGIMKHEMNSLLISHII